jgi:hypothetical protein
LYSLLIHSPLPGQSIDFEFTKRAGASVSYNDFTEFRLFIEASNTLLARAVIANTTVQKPALPLTPVGMTPGAATGVAGVIGATMSMPSPTAAAIRPSATPQQQSEGFDAAPPALGLFFAAALMALF